MLARITGKSYRDEARPSTCTFDLVRSVRVRRFRWLGHILRFGREHRYRLVYQAIMTQYDSGVEADLFQDAPRHMSWYHLELLAKDK